MYLTKNNNNNIIILKSCTVGCKCVRLLISMQYIDGVFNFLDTYEERSLKLKVLEHDAKEEKEKLEKSLQEVGHCQRIW